MKTAVAVAFEERVNIKPVQCSRPAFVSMAWLALDNIVNVEKLRYHLTINGHLNKNQIKIEM